MKARRTLILIEDEPILARVFERLLEPSFDVVCFHRADHALDALQRGHSCDAILCDMHLPDATGVEVHGRLSKTRPDLAGRMIFMTGGAVGTMEAFLDEHADRVLRKPFAREDLLAILARVTPLCEGS
ncbi:MAG: response regulator [Acidobacteriota bacterium]